MAKQGREHSQFESAGEQVFGLLTSMYSDTLPIGDGTTLEECDALIRDYNLIENVARMSRRVAEKRREQLLDSGESVAVDNEVSSEPASLPVALHEPYLGVPPMSLLVFSLRSNDKISSQPKSNQTQHERYKLFREGVASMLELPPENRNHEAGMVAGRILRYESRYDLTFRPVYGKGLTFNGINPDDARYEAQAETLIETKVNWRVFYVMGLIAEGEKNIPEEWVRLHAELAEQGRQQAVLAQERNGASRES